MTVTSCKDNPRRLRYSCNISTTTLYKPSFYRAQLGEGLKVHQTLSCCIILICNLNGWIMERKRSSGFHRIFTVAFDRLFQVRLCQVNVNDYPAGVRNQLSRVRPPADPNFKIFVNRGITYHNLAQFCSQGLFKIFFFILQKISLKCLNV